MIPHAALKRKHISGLRSVLGFIVFVGAHTFIAFMIFVIKVLIIRVANRVRTRCFPLPQIGYAVGITGTYGHFVRIVSVNVAKGCAPDRHAAYRSEPAGTGLEQGTINVPCGVR